MLVEQWIVKVEYAIFYSMYGYHFLEVLKDSEDNSYLWEFRSEKEFPGAEILFQCWEGCIVFRRNLHHPLSNVPKGLLKLSECCPLFLCNKRYPRSTQEQDRHEGLPICCPKGNNRATVHSQNIHRTASYMRICSYLGGRILYKSQEVSPANNAMFTWRPKKARELNLIQKIYPISDRRS